MRYKNLEEFIEKAVIVYEGNQDWDLDDATKVLYERAVEEMVHWVRCKLLEELMSADGTNDAKAVIYLPTTEVTVTVSTEWARGKFAIFEHPAPLPMPDSRIFAESDESDWLYAERFRLPYGEVDSFVHNAVMTEAGNPVAVLYEYLCRKMKELRNLARLKKIDSDLLGEDVLAENNIVDVLGIHRMQMNLTSFLDMPKKAQRNE